MEKQARYALKEKTVIMTIMIIIMILSAHGSPLLPHTKYPIKKPTLGPSVLTLLREVAKHLFACIFFLRPVLSHEQLFQGGTVSQIHANNM